MLHERAVKTPDYNGRQKNEKNKRQDDNKSKTTNTQIPLHMFPFEKIENKKIKII